jgi:hypothetical protein
MFRLVLCVLLGLATFKLALAEPQPQPQEDPTVPVTTLPLMIQCTAAEIVERMVEEYDELPFIEGNGSWQIPNGQNINGRVEMYVNPSTGSFTIVIPLGTDVKCVVISGKDLKPMLSDKNST